MIKHIKEGRVEVEDIEAEVERIRLMAGDYEAAHGNEDKLHQRVLKEIASGRYEAGHCEAMAEAALQTLTIQFPRHCA